MEVSLMPIPNKHVKTYRVSVQRRNLISLPREIRESLRINEGDILNVRVESNKIVMEPYRLIPSSQTYFWTESAQKDMLDAKDDVESGKVREFSNVNEFLKGLDDD